MDQEFKRLPVGEENFGNIRRNNFYYADKTQLIETLLSHWGKANLFTRPRRFGKSLNMSMLKHFFEIGCDKSLFEGLYISQNETLCERYMGKFPVISISLKSVDAVNYEASRAMLVKIVNEEARRHQYLLQSDCLTDIDRQIFSSLLDDGMTEATLAYSIREMTELLNKHHGQQVIVLIDEYDVPLAKANEHGFYDEMVSLIRNFLANVLKTNDHLYFAVLTGCLRVAKESIFTGLNNFRVHSLTDITFDEYFGFTDDEVRDILEYYHQTGEYDTIKEWYDGYRFGNMDVYCPWDVICYCADHQDHPDKAPGNYWLHTSDNQVIYHFIEGMGRQRSLTRLELEKLVNGESVQKEIFQELTYKELYTSASHLWSALFMTGYLTYRGNPEGNRYQMVIPNREIRNIITEHILTLFEQQVQTDGELLNDFCSALIEGRAGEVEALFTRYMQKTISVRDTFVRKHTKENFYHGILLGILGFKEGWTVQSNKETGNGFSDIMIQTDDLEMGIIIEVKYAEDDRMDMECQRALNQIDENCYVDALRQEGIVKILKYAIVCNRKTCRVLLARE